MVNKGNKSPKILPGLCSSTEIIYKRGRKYQKKLSKKFPHIFLHVSHPYIRGCICHLRWPVTTSLFIVLSCLNALNLSLIHLLFASILISLDCGPTPLLLLVKTHCISGYWLQRWVHWFHSYFLDKHRSCDSSHAFCGSPSIGGFHWAVGYKLKPQPQPPTSCLILCF